MTERTASLLRGFAAYERRDDALNAALQEHRRDMVENVIPAIEQDQREAAIAAAKARLAPCLTRCDSGGNWYVVQNGFRIASGFDNEAEALEWIREHAKG